jgi:tRNA dimethylallyltransferase
MASDIILITGQTGTGKTSLALEWAQKIHGHILSADSRQIYNEMDIGTGKVDSPHDLKKENDTWYLKDVPIYGINLINPDEFCSAGTFAEYAQGILKTQSMNPIIIVGGTGFYIKSLLLPDESLSITANEALRKRYADLEKELPQKEFVQLLQSDLAAKDADRLDRMNNSDRNNPRRLVRAIEVADVKKIQQTHIQDLQYPIKAWIGLHAPKEYLENKITQRVQEMFKHGFEKEVQTLLTKYSWNTPGLQTIGYKEWHDYFDNKISQEELQKNIIRSHLQYARKQMMYFKRFPQIHWCDISKADWKQKLQEYCNLP